jgi:uncharacterized membrane protein
VTTVQHSVSVNASPDAIEAYSRYADSWPDWFPGVVGVEVDDMYPEINSSAQVTFQAAGTTFDLTMIVLEYLPGERVVYELQGMAQGQASFGIFVDNDEQWVDGIIEYELPGGVLGRIADRAIVEQRVAESLQQALYNLKAGVEN